MNSNKYSPQIRYVASAGSLPNRNGANWTSPLTLTGFLEPGAHLIRYLVDPGSRNHGSELPYDGGDLNAYKKFIDALERSHDGTSQARWGSGISPPGM
jgi:hypothetical protein